MPPVGGVVDPAVDAVVVCTNPTLGVTPFVIDVGAYRNHCNKAAIVSAGSVPPAIVLILGNFVAEVVKSSFPRTTTPWWREFWQASVGEFDTDDPLGLECKPDWFA
jgi:hypothetical protein